MSSGLGAPLSLAAKSLLFSDGGLIIHYEVLIMTTEPLSARISVDPNVCGGNPCIRGTRIYVAIVLDALAEGLTPEQIIDHYPNLAREDVLAAAAYGAELARENIWKLAST